MTWLTSEQALAMLGTKPQSLYASVSRGRIRTRPDPGDPRRSLYDRDDIDRLARRAAGRRTTGTVAAETIRWGDPVLPSGITTIADGRLYYRGRDAVSLAYSASLEDIAALLWESAPVSFGAPRSPATGDPTITPLHRGLATLADRVATGAPTLGQPMPSLHAEATEIVAALASALGAVAMEAPLHRRLASAWRRPEAAHLLRRALVLLADHELNASTFAARITASTGASLAAAVLSGLATLTGPLHGGAPAEIAKLAAAIRRDGPAVVVKSYRGQQRQLPGFGHRLYPDGDPRAEALLADFPLPPAFAALDAIGRDLTGEAPNVDFALAALAGAQALPPDAPLLLFALARSVGWLAHAMEQVATGTLIRPRAEYVGTPTGG